MKTPIGRTSRDSKRGTQGSARPRSPPRRFVIGDTGVNIWGWPSRGGLITLDRVAPLDMDFLGLHPVELPRYRDDDQDAEDQLCQRLLALGAKWFDSEARRALVAGVAAQEDVEMDAVMLEGTPAPSTMERRWVQVAYPNGLEGGFWVAEFETSMFGWQERDNFVPENAELVHLARTMDEKARLLEKIGGKYYASLDEYDGAACLNAWKLKTSGEFGPLERQQHQR